MKHHLVVTHIMWYEIEMLPEYLASLQESTALAKWPIVFYFLLNAQTYLETPNEDGDALELVHTMQQQIMEFFQRDTEHKNHITIRIVGMNDSFYNIGDCRREHVNKDDGYTVWGEIDCLYPTKYFQALELIASEPFEYPHVVSFASRKCWDNTWTPVEHIKLQMLPCVTKEERKIPALLNWDDYITQEELNTFNATQTSAVPLLELPHLKFDGALLAFSTGMPQLIPDDMHFAREDWCAQIVLECVYPHIKQYHVSTILKGHNYFHPKKRMYTTSTRGDGVYKQAERTSFLSAKRWLNNFGIEFLPNGTIVRHTNDR